jgi:septal ring factor EnvC (AmiA/AmiB activator)
MNYSEEIENLENKIKMDRRNLETLKKCVEELYLKVEFLENQITELVVTKKKKVKKTDGEQTSS